MGEGGGVQNGGKSDPQPIIIHCSFSDNALVSIRMRGRGAMRLLNSVHITAS